MHLLAQSWCRRAFCQQAVHQGFSLPTGPIWCAFTCSTVPCPTNCKAVTRCTPCLLASKLGITGASLTPALRLQNLSNVTACSRLHTLQCNQLVKVVALSDIHSCTPDMGIAASHYTFTPPFMEIKAGFAQKWTVLLYIPLISSDGIALWTRSSTCAILEVCKSLVGTAAHHTVLEECGKCKFLKVHNSLAAQSRFNNPPNPIVQDARARPRK